MPVPILDNVFQELTRYKNPSGKPVLREVEYADNKTKTLLILFDDIDVRTSFSKKAGLGQLPSRSDYIVNILNQLGFKPLASRLKLRFRLADHPRYNVTIHAYQKILLPSYSPEENNWTDLFKERLDEKSRKYQGIRDSLRKYHSPVSSPSGSPQAESSGFFSAHNPWTSQYEQNMRQTIGQSLITAYQHGDMPGPSNFLQTAQSGGPVRRLTPSTSQRSAPYSRPARQESHPMLCSLLESPSSPSSPTRQRSLSPYAQPPLSIQPPGAPRPPSRPQTPLFPQRQVVSSNPIYDNPSSEDFNDILETLRFHARTPSPRR
ncbi:hypothetical protein [Xenorhabdus eapokensis]|uniref:Uncharacterized protein n=1 Tax=Xenorhabdus eapokensis TaxID=1873482 RepID=A0A1Q5TPX3_9GAMM|nr:hypothetical protein [Xenorhabdus eapokensis]OKP02275.1 hypothetical protein Xedl_02434 [Xenorhabdus eapokensis]